MVMTSTEAWNGLRPFMGRSQQAAIEWALRGEEREFFAEKVQEMAGIIQSMPKTYEQDGKGDQALVYLHYLYGGADWFITERDMEGDGTLQAFGLADLGYGAELGYISIQELVQSGVELDLYWQVRTLAEIGNGR